MLNIDRVIDKLNFMSKYLKKMEKFTLITLEEYLNNEDYQLIVERMLELMIQSAIDINKHLITKHLNLNFTSGKNSFLILKDYQILTENLALDLSKSVNLRNLLAHEYLDINNRIIFNIIPQAISQYSLYIQEIKIYLTSLDYPD